MVSRKNLNNKFVLISVYNKKDLAYLCKNLNKHQYSFIATGSTYKKIIKLGYNCLKVSQITKFKEILNGRVKTLNHKIFASILYDRSNKKNVMEFQNLKCPKIDIVVVNLYPFKQFTKNNNIKKIIDMIDIGGPSLIRAASKNFENVTPISSINYYKTLINNLDKNNGITDIDFRRKMAASSFKLISAYDNDIFQWLNYFKKEKKVELKYGENPNQNSYLLKTISNKINDYQLSGKKISYNNIIDVDSGYNCLNEFNEPTCIIIKHTNTCGAASSSNINKAFQKAYEADIKSSFGGIVLLNRKLDIKLARSIYNKFFEVIVSPKFDIDALNILKEKKNLILLEIDKLKINNDDFKSTIFGKLFQSKNKIKINKQFLRLASLKKASAKDLDDLIFSIKIVKHLKSNAVILSKNKQSIGIGCGQTNRIDALKIALNNMKIRFNSKNFVCASDGFFPFTDGVKLLKKNKCNVIAAPNGSINDGEIIKYSITNNQSIYFTKQRLFKH